MAKLRTILIIEDNELNREMLSAILEEEYNVLQAENGAEGLEILQREGNNISLILLDIQMPVMNGYEFLEAVVKDGSLSDIPIIVTTAGDTDEEQIKCLSMGASDFVIKPYNPEIVKKRTESLIRLRETFLMLHKVERDGVTGLYNKESFCAYALQKINSDFDHEYDMVCLEIESYHILTGKYGIKKCESSLRFLTKSYYKIKTNDMIFGRVGEAQIAILMKHKSIEEHIENYRKNVNFEPSKVVPNLKINCGVYSNIDKNIGISEIINNALLPIDKIRNQYEQFIAEYDSSIKDKLIRKQLLESTGKIGLSENQFKVYYQPKYDVNNNTVGGAEALIRWIHPEMGFMNPGEFIPLFESTGFIYEIDYFVFETVCKDLRRWLDENKKVVPISVNVSQIDFDQPNLAQVYSSIAQKYSIPKDLIHLEITESANASDKNKKTQTIFEFK
ncbi:MAG: EAL domain-containing protein, partial [Sphaerochaetaceae bacterium]|nr:EAL domain-containing protein [Sphaerochaetaceae bacterium]